MAEDHVPYSVDIIIYQFCHMHSFHEELVLFFEESYIRSYFLIIVNLQLINFLNVFASTYENKNISELL